MALSYGANGYGPVYETELPFDSVYDEKNTNSYYKLKDISEVNLNQQPIAKIKDMSLYSTTTKSSSEKEALRTKIKEQIVKNGAVLATMFVDFGTTSEGYIDSKNGYYNTDNYAYYCNDSTATINHSVAIVGWDDNFDRNKFVNGKQPSSNGAYIVLNSYGSKFGNNGYFYVSYEDTTIQSGLMGINEITDYNNKGKDYDYVYQYDELGMSTVLIDSKITTANVFNSKELQKGKVEYLKEIGIQLMNAQGVEIYVNTSGNDFNNLTKVASYTGANALEAGYHTIELPTPLKIEGDKFIVAVKYINSSGSIAPIECNLKDSNMSYQNTIWDKAKANDGESYISTDDGKTWMELNGIEIDSTHILKNTNACIKAFTVEQNDLNIHVTGVTLDKTKYTLTEGATGNLVATISPNDAIEKGITWESSNKKVATISDSGVITAISAGTTVITATTVDGGFTAKCELTVKKKVDNSDDKYIAKDDNNKNGNTNKKTTSIKDTTKNNVDKTLAKSKLPYTGITSIIIAIITVSGIAIIIYTKIRKYKDIK